MILPFYSKFTVQANVDQGSYIWSDRHNGLYDDDDGSREIRGPDYDPVSMFVLRKFKELSPVVKYSGLVKSEVCCVLYRGLHF